MPFLGLQVLWGELRGPGSQREPPAKDEAHGDGLGYSAHIPPEGRGWEEQGVGAAGLTLRPVGHPDCCLSTSAGQRIDMATSGTGTTTSAWPSCSMTMW